MKKLLMIAIAAAMLFASVGCVGTKIVHCDRCGKEVKMSADSGVTEDWLICCEECQQEINGSEGSGD